MAIAIAGPLIAEARPPTVYEMACSPTPMVAIVSVRNGMPNCVPTVSMMVPTSSEQNKPCAIAPSASTRYRLTDISISLRFRNSLNVLIFTPWLYDVMSRVLTHATIILRAVRNLSIGILYKDFLSVSGRLDKGPCGGRKRYAPALSAGRIPRFPAPDGAPGLVWGL